MRNLLLLSALGLSAFSSAWNDTGHMLVAAVAQEDLKPAVLARVNELLKINLAPEDKPNKPTNTFYMAACWADDHKDSDNGPWHYINIHFREDGKPTKNEALNQNVAWAINKFKAVLSDKAASDTDKARALKFLIHFVGDVHQPFHAIARDTEESPDGDRGGNSFKIAPIDGWGNRPVDNLHAFWDFGAGSFLGSSRPLSGDANRDLQNRANNLRTKTYPRSHFKDVKVHDPMKWAEEGFAMRSHLYNLKQNEVVPESYRTWAKGVSNERVTLAGYRLADLLNEALGAK
ncbi:MAG: S1/P1 nuclease [Armatimonadetes bacterium]|nr:S1/P1 nuclease [Armatimonadota bacterium]